MKGKAKELTIIIPVFNEEEGISRIIPAFESYVALSKFEVNILLVNDGSTDNSLTEIKKVKAFYEHVAFISFAKNAGLSAAIRAGFEVLNGLAT